MGEFIALSVMLGLIFAYIVFVIGQTFKKYKNDITSDITSLKQRIVELEDEVKKLKK